ncbi:hypothetical protein P153DRAFT_283937, partial [Dothidotthia symphoricarpi CBS 119687]
PDSRCTSPIGFTVIDAPAEKRLYRGRDFFKLSRIGLQCELSTGNWILVEPHEDASSKLLAVEDSTSPSPTLAKPPTVPTEAMEIDSRLPGIQHHGLHQHHHEEHHEFHRQHQIEANRKSLPPPSMIRSPNTPHLHPLPHKASSNPPLPKPSAVELVHELQPPIRDPGAGITNQTHTLPSIVSHPTNTSGASHLTNGHHYPHAPQQVQLDAIERLQTQISQNSSTLAAQNRDIRQTEKSVQLVEENMRREYQTQLQHQSVDIRRMDETVGRLYHEMQGIRQVIEGFSREMQSIRNERLVHSTAPPPGQQTSAQDSALELMAHQMAGISQKVNEVDTMRLTIEIMKNKIQRLEGGPPTMPCPQPVSQDQSGHPAHSSHTPVSYHVAPTAAPQINAPLHPSQRSQPHPSILSSTVPLEASQRPEPVSRHSSWATVNAGVKRPHTNGVESPREVLAHATGSPKRQRTGTNEFNGGYVASQGPPPAHAYDMQVQSQMHTLPSQPHVTSESTLTSETQHPVHTPYGTQDSPSDNSWQPESQRIVEHRPRGRPRGSGRGGRGRKSMPAQVHPMGTPDWDREDWQGVPNSQASPEGHYNHIAHPGKGIARRGNGGGGRGGYTPDRAASLGLQGVTASMGAVSPDDFYGSAKKSRSKPIRNADGVLIRKDGRPDMRSQSSAANLRKVNAKKDGMSFTSFQDTASTAPNTPSPSGHAPIELDAAAKKHNDIMGRMFPRGMDESRKDHDYARQVFDEDHNSTAHPRVQNYHAQQHPPSKSPHEVKNERVEQDRVVELQISKDGDTNMDRESESHTPGEHSDNEQEQHDGRPQVQQLSSENSVAVSETPDIDSSATLAVETQVSS